MVAGDVRTRSNGAATRRCSDANRSLLFCDQPVTCSSPTWRSAWRPPRSRSVAISNCWKPKAWCAAFMAARCLCLTAPTSRPFSRKSRQFMDEKRRIGAPPPDSVNDGDAIILSPGTTTMEVARQLHGRRNLTVVTSAVNIAAQLAREPEIEVIVTGGVLRGTTYALVGSLADENLRRLHANTLFLGRQRTDRRQRSHDTRPDRRRDRSGARLRLPNGSSSRSTTARSGGRRFARQPRSAASRSWSPTRGCRPSKNVPLPRPAVEVILA